MERNKRRLLLFGLLSVGMITFIFIRSTLPADESDAESLAAVNFLWGLLRRIPGVSESTWNNIIRKIAHFAEFAALGALIGGFTFSLFEVRGVRYFSLPLLACLMTAVLDELIQTFVQGRSGSPRDVLLDFCGSIIGLLFAAAVIRLFRRRKERKKTKNNG